MTILYHCDGPKCDQTQPGRGKSQAIPATWVYVPDDDGHGMHLCLVCEQRRIAERDGE